MIRQIKYIIFIIFIAALGFSQGDAVAKQGTSGVQALTFSPDAKFAGMGNAFAGYENTGASAAFYNPATLVYGKGPSFMFGNVSWFADIGFIAFSGSYILPNGSAVAAHFRMLDSGQMIERTVSEPEGTGRTFDYKDFILGGSYSTFLTDRFSFGASLLWVRESVSLYNYSAGTWSIDLGTFYQTGFRTLKLGLNIKNFGSELDWNQTFDDYSGGAIEPVPEPFRTYHMPLQFQVGLSYEFFEDDDQQTLIIGLDGVHPNDAVERFNLGAEYNYMNIISLRSGLYTNHDSASLMAGFGLDLQEFTGQKVTVEYSVSKYGILGFVHQFSLGYEL
ncbi:MAG: PorV/PorQ family protein [FCB group bacterium]|nr:PorV/PorQ family protein [FCB group bacterium]